MRRHQAIGRRPRRNVNISISFLSQQLRIFWDPRGVCVCVCRKSKAADQEVEDQRGGGVEGKRPERVGAPAAARAGAGDRRTRGQRGPDPEAGRAGGREAGGRKGPKEDEEEEEKDRAGGSKSQSRRREDRRPEPEARRAGGKESRRPDRERGRAGGRRAKARGPRPQVGGWRRNPRPSQKPEGPILQRMVRLIFSGRLVDKLIIDA